MAANHLTRVDAVRNMSRFYKLDVQPTLFGEWALVREWGRIGRGGQMKSCVYPTLQGALSALERVYLAKTGRGYQTRGGDGGEA